MTSSRHNAACSATGKPSLHAGPITERSAELAPEFTLADPDSEPASAPLTERDVEKHVHGICFKTGPPGRIGVELEWLVRDGRDPGLPVDQQRVAAALAGLGAPDALPGCGRITREPGGQIELSSAPAVGLGACVATTCHDLTALRQAIGPAGLCLAGEGLDPLRSPRRVLDLPRYAAMEEFFNRDGPWGRLMMCSTASVQVCLDAGEEGSGPAGLHWRWRLLHALGPVLVGAFANSPIRSGRPTGWKSTRQAIWARLDRTRTSPPRHAEPTPPGSPAGSPRENGDPREAWVDYALDAEVMCVREPGSQAWCAPPGLTFRDWLRGAGERPPTLGDLIYHLSTLFPPVRPQGHLELRVIDAQPGDGWIVPAAVVCALLDDPVAAEQAMAAVEELWYAGRPAAGRQRENGARSTGAAWDHGSVWQRAARQGPADPAIAAASLRCFEAAEAALDRLGAPAYVKRAVAAFAERYVERDRCPADDRLEESRQEGQRDPHIAPEE
jgi:glutamate--cysteine ligase